LLVEKVVRLDLVIGEVIDMEKIAHLKDIVNDDVVINVMVLNEFPSYTKQIDYYS